MKYLRTAIDWALLPLWISLAILIVIGDFAKLIGDTVHHWIYRDRLHL